MMIRAGLLFGSGGAVAAQGLLFKVHASNQETGSKKKFCPSEFPIYGDPDPVEYEVIEEEETTFRQYVSSARKWTWHNLESIQSTTDKVKQKYDVAKAHTQDALAYIREDSAVIPRATIITVAGLGGIVAGYRGGIIRKALYASVGMAAAASVCYPHEAQDIAKQGWSAVRDFAYATYSDLSGGSREKIREAKKSKVLEPKSEEKSKPTSAVDAPGAKMDFGMSKPEDKDMYSTRGN